MLSALAPRVALATPLEEETFPLIAVLCDDCARKARSKPSVPRLVAHVGTYDEAIRCPKCGDVPLHPLPRVDIGELHPVARCVRGSSRRCMAHLGDELDADGLCPAGQVIYDQAVTEMSRRKGSPTSRDRNLLDALLRAQRRRPSLPQAFLPVFAALARADPEAARALEHIHGASLDTELADPELVDKLTPRPGLATVLTAVENAVDQGFRTFIDGLVDGSQVSRPPTRKRPTARRTGVR
jgi:hypothetical protein